jgi:integrase/recombinase XerD
MRGCPSYEKTNYDSIARFTGHVQLKGLRARSVEAYVAVVRILAGWAGEDPAELGEERVREFFLHLVRERGYASKSIRQARAALGSFYRDMLDHPDWKVFGEVRTKDREQLPQVLDRAEVRMILTEVKEPRFAVPLRLIYLCGLRLSECLHVEVRDIHREQQRLHIRDGKGGKDRYVPLPQAALDELTGWWKRHRHPRYLFPAMGHGWRATQRKKEAEQERVQRELLRSAEHPMSTSGMQRVFQLAVAASGVKKRATIHTLRHSYATHLLEEGVSLRYVSQYLGHASIQQTVIYTHLTAVSEAQTQQAVARLATTLGTHS